LSGLEARVATHPIALTVVRATKSLLPPLSSSARACRRLPLPTTYSARPHIMATPRMVQWASGCWLGTFMYVTKL
jgi:hypothetical protein